MQYAAPTFFSAHFLSLPQVYDSHSFAAAQAAPTALRALHVLPAASNVGLSQNKLSMQFASEKQWPSPPTLGAHFQSACAMAGRHACATGSLQDARAAANVTSAGLPVPLAGLPEAPGIRLPAAIPRRPGGPTTKAEMPKAQVGPRR